MHWLEFFSHDTDVFIILLIISIKNEKILISNNNRIKPMLPMLPWDIFFPGWFVFVEYDLFNTTIFIQNFINIIFL